MRLFEGAKSGSTGKRPTRAAAKLIFDSLLAASPGRRKIRPGPFTAHALRR